MKAILPLILHLVVSAQSQSLESGGMTAPKGQAAAKVKVEKDLVSLVFFDGREGAFFLEHGPIRQGRVKLNQVENTCRPDLQLTQCAWKLYGTQIEASLKWTVHPDPKKIGQTVSFKNKVNSGQTELTPIAVTNFFTPFSASRFYDLPHFNSLPVQLECKSTEWIKEAWGSLKEGQFESIASEFMFMNNETSINENSTSSEIYQPFFQQVSPYAFELKSYKSDSGLFSLSEPFISDQVSHIVYDKKGEAKNCEVAFTSDVSELLMIVSDESFTKLDPKTRRPLLKIGQFASSELSFFIERMTSTDFGNDMVFE